MTLLRENDARERHRYAVALAGDLPHSDHETPENDRPSSTDGGWLSRNGWLSRGAWRHRGGAWLAKGGPLRRAFRELALVAVLFLAYKLGRIAATGHVEQAMTNALDVLQFERWLRLPDEWSVQQLVIGHGWLIKVANYYYACVHFPATAACLVWLYAYRRADYLRTRRTLAWVTAVSLVVHLLMPLAPPRMLGMVDTGKVFGPSVYGTPGTDHLSNQYAAMPSLHVAWALAVALALIGVTRGRRRWLWLAHPLITLIVVVCTGNHYWLDAVVGCTILGVVVAVQRYRSRIAASSPVAVPAARLGS